MPYSIRGVKDVILARTEKKHALSGARAQEGVYLPALPPITQWAQYVMMLVASAHTLANSGGVVMRAFLPTKSWSVTPRARAHPPQT